MLPSVTADWADAMPTSRSAGMQDLSDDEDGALLVHENDVDPSSEEEDLADQDSNGAWALCSPAAVGSVPDGDALTSGRGERLQERLSIRRGSRLRQL